MARSAWLLAALVGSFALSGCNFDSPVASTPPPAAPPPQAPAAADLSGLPDGAPCTKKINKYQSVIAADHDSGNVNDSVFGEIEHEISDAAAACTDGKGAKALSLVRASQVKHGYHT